MAIDPDHLFKKERKEVTAKKCKNCQVVFPKEYDKCPKCALSTIIAFGK